MNTTTAISTTQESLRKDLTELDAWRASLLKKISEVENMGKEDLQNKLESLPQHLGVENIDEAIKLLKRSRNNKVYRVKHKNIVPFKATWGRGKKLPDEIKGDIITLLKSNKYTTKEISTRMKVSSAAINNIKKSAGLVHERSLFSIG